MKKIIGALVAVGIALALVGCDTVTPTGGSMDLVATWTNVAKSYTEINPAPAASNLEGTWNKTDITYPNVPTVTVSTGSTTATTNYNGNETTTITHTIDLVIEASGSYVKTDKTVTAWTARDAVTATGATGTTNQIYAGSQTSTTTETVTVSIEGSNYKQVKKTVVATVYAGKGKFTGTDYVATDNSSSTTTTTSYVTDYHGLAYRTAVVGGMTQTVKGNTTAAPSNLVGTTTTTTTWTFVKDGTYTETIVSVYDQPALPAVAATANSAAIIATEAGTTTSTATVTGNFSTQDLVQPDVSTASLAQKQAALWLYQKEKTVSQIGTGSQISESFPATAKTSFTASLATKKYTISINKEALLVNDGSDNFMYTKEATK